MSKVNRRALIFGVSGQDGAYLAEFLINKGYQVFGTSRDVENSSFENLKKLNIASDEQVFYLSGNVQKVVVGGNNCPSGYENYIEFPNYIPKVGKPYICLDGKYIERGKTCPFDTVNYGGFCYSMNCPSGYDADFNSVTGTVRGVTGYCKKK